MKRSSNQLPTTEIRRLAISLAVALACVGFSAQAGATDFEVTSDNNIKKTGTSEDTIDFKPTGNSINNSAEIEGFGTLTVKNWTTLTNTNEGWIEVGHYGKTDTVSENGTIDNQGTLIINDSNFQLGLRNSGKVLSATGTLNIVNKPFEILENSSITKSDGSVMDEIRVDHQDRVGSVKIHEQAKLVANKIYFNVNDQGFILDGAIEGSTIQVDGSYINLGSAASIVGDEVTLTQIDQTSSGSRGGVINASQKLNFRSYVDFVGAKISAPEITFSQAGNLRDGATISGVKTLTARSTLSLHDNAGFKDNVIETLNLAAVEGTANGPRIQLMGTNSLSIGTLNIGKSTNADGQVVSANIVDKMTSSAEGGTSFQIENMNVESGALAAVYADDKSETAAKTKLEITNLEAGEGSEIQFGWRTGTYSGFEAQTVETLTLQANSSLNGKPDDKIPAIGAEVHNIVLAGDNASVTTSLIGPVTNIALRGGVSGAHIEDVQTNALNVYVEKTTEQPALTVQTTSNETDVKVTGAALNNTGDAQADLQRVASSVAFVSKAEAGQTMTVAQDASAIFDSASAQASTAADGTVIISDIQTFENPHVYGIAQMAATGLSIWRNEINDMNKRLGELRDSSAQSNGVWARVYNGKAKYGSQSVSNKYTAFQFGYDRQVVPGVWLGGAFSYTDGDNDFSNGGGASSIYAFTAYGSWLFDNGAFVDVTGKIGRLKNEFSVMQEGVASEGDYHANSYSLSAEFGWRLHLFSTKLLFIAPQAELMYGRVASVDYTTSTGVRVENDAADALVGRVGFALGLTCPNKMGNAYIRASVLHDWQGEAGYSFTKDGFTRRLSEDLGGTWYEYGLGGNFNVSDKVYVYADLERADGGEVDTEYRVNLGVRYSF